MGEIIISQNKTLKLQNLLCYHVDVSSDEYNLIDREITRMNTFINTHGSRQVGPLIIYSKAISDESEEFNIDVQIILQSNKFIDEVHKPYQMIPVLRVRNCLYAHFVGPEDKQELAYDKLRIYAFEHDLELDGSNYTIYLVQNEEEETVVVDVFMPLKENT